jgi:hypothetical protein
MELRPVQNLSACTRVTFTFYLLFPFLLVIVNFSNNTITIVLSLMKDQLGPKHVGAGVL